MTPIHHHAHKVVHHVRTHHRKYLFLGSAMAGIFAVTKIMVLFATSFAVFSSSHDVSFADDNPLNTLDMTSSVNTGVVTTESEESSDSTGSVSTGDTTIDTGALIDLIAYSVAQTMTGSTTSGEDSIDTLSGSISSGTIVTTGTTVTTGQSEDTSGVVAASTQYYEELLNNQITYCHTGDIIMSEELSGTTFSDIASFQWLYSGNCTITDSLSFQLYDHNNQWIEITTLASSNFGFSFDTNFLYTGGWYATTGLNASGIVYTIDPGLYSGVASNFGAGYKVRILNTVNREILYQSSGFTIDNLAPQISGFQFVYFTGGDTSGEVHLFFSATEELGDISIDLSKGKAASKTASGTQYDLYLRGYGTGFSGAIGFTIDFADLWGNTGSVSGTGYLSFTGASTIILADTGISLLSQLKEQLDNFNECKESLTYKTISLNVGGNYLSLNMPNFKKSEVKKLISAFSSSVIDKLDEVNNLDQTELDSLTKTYNNFLVVLKLVKDDENTCEQKLSNYYMGLFTSTLENYGIDL